MERGQPNVEAIRMGDVWEARLRLHHGEPSTPLTLTFPSGTLPLFHDPKDAANLIPDRTLHAAQAHGIAKAKGHTDTSTPKVAWAHRKQRDAYRATKFTDPVYVNTGGYEVQWSQQEAIVARRYMDMHERAVNTSGYVNTRINPKVIQFSKWRDRQREAVAAPISVPMGDLHNPKKKRPTKSRPKTSQDKSGEGDSGGISKQSQLLLDQMASRVLQSAMSAASNDNVRSMLVKAMENPQDNPLRGQGYNPDKDAPMEHESRAMYVYHSRHNSITLFLVSRCLTEPFPVIPGTNAT